MKLALPLLLVAAASAMRKLTSYAIALSKVYRYFLLINLITDTKLLILDAKRIQLLSRMLCYSQPTASRQVDGPFYVRDESFKMCRGQE